jgi:hypothetical protein
VVTVSISSGSWMNSTPNLRNLSYSALRSSTANEVYGMPSSTSACLNGFAAGCPSGSSNNSVPSGCSGETTVSQRASLTRYLIASYTLNSGMYIEITMKPTTEPTSTIMTGSRIAVSALMAAATSSS